MSIMKSLLKVLVFPVAVILIANSLLTNTKVTDGAAHTFLANYYSAAIESSGRLKAYNEDLTSNFRSFPASYWQDYAAFWKDQKKVVLNSVAPVPGNSLEFIIRVDFYSKKDQHLTDVADIWFVCNGFINQIIARIPSAGCPTRSLKIDNAQIVTQGY